MTLTYTLSAASAALPVLELVNQSCVIGELGVHGLENRLEGVLRGRRFRRRGGLSQDAERLLAHERADALDLDKVFLGDVCVAGVRRVILAVGGEALGDAHARAVELADDPLLVLGGGALGRGVDEVGG